MKAKVYFTDMHATMGQNLQQKLARLIKTAGIDRIDFDKKFTAIKIHFGEPGNLSVPTAQLCEDRCGYGEGTGRKPFLTDCNTLYVGGRKNALDHLDSAYLNGFSPFSTGCHLLIADGLKGTDETLVPVEGGEHVGRRRSGARSWMPIS